MAESYPGEFGDECRCYGDNDPCVPCRMNSELTLLRKELSQRENAKAFYCGFHGLKYDASNEYTTDAVTLGESRMEELISLRADKERLDWFSEQHGELMRETGANLVGVIGCCHSILVKPNQDLRAAIDSAREGD